MNVPRVLPGATVGILGSGQLGRMLALSAREMGYRVHTYSPDRHSPTGQVADAEHIGAYDDAAEMARFAQSVDVLTYEFENISSDAVAAAEQHAPVRPGRLALHTAQSRLREKRFLQECGFDLAPWTHLPADADAAALTAAAAQVGLPLIGKTTGYGYDGKGQFRADTTAALVQGRDQLNGDLVLERVIEFRCELSVVAVRTVAGEVSDFGVFENRHNQRHILDTTVLPAPISPALAARARQLAHGIVDQLELVGVLCIEMFLDGDDRLLVNELAPRPHNSGHLTIDACSCSQFDLQLRAVCGLPLPEVVQHRPAAMANLLGDLWPPNGDPDWTAALDDPAVRLHLYGKQQARAGRKMGHLTVLADSVEEARTRALDARGSLGGDE